MYVCMYECVAYTYTYVCTMYVLPPLNIGTPSKDISKYLAPMVVWGGNIFMCVCVCMYVCMYVCVAYGRPLKL